MNNREQNRRANDALQSGEGDPALGQDARDFGAGGQTVSNTQGQGSPADREVGRDTTVPDRLDESPSSRDD